MDKEQLRSLIRRVLSRHNLIYYEDEREVELLMLTAAVESNLGYYIKQVKGPALGIFQMEPATHKDILENYVAYKKTLLDTVKKSLTSVWVVSADELEYNVYHAIIMARIHYLRKPTTIPPASDIKGLATYWKNHYNTVLGKGTVEKAIEAYNKYCV